MSGPLRGIPPPSGLNEPTQEDPVRQQTTPVLAAALAPTVGAGFEGLGNGSLGFSVTSAPPDTDGALGLTQYARGATCASEHGSLSPLQVSSLPLFFDWPLSRSERCHLLIGGKG